MSQNGEAGSKFLAVYQMSYDLDLGPWIGRCYTGTFAFNIQTISALHEILLMHEQIILEWTV